MKPVKATPKQKLLQWLYPVLMAVRNLTGKKKIQQNRQPVSPPVSLYDLSVTLINGKELPLETLRGKKLLIVNTASECGYTAQYAELQKLYQHSKEDLEIIAFPSNDFGEQEKGSDAEIGAFCTSRFSVRFPLTRKSTVVVRNDQHPVYRWLTNKDLNGWNEQPPVWNFSKYLVNEQGVLTHYFDPGVSPLSEEVIKAIND